MERIAAIDIQSGPLLRIAHGWVRREHVIVHNVAVRWLPGAIPPACSYLPSIVDLPAPADSDEVLAVEVPVVLATPVFIVHPVAIPGIDEVGRPALIELARQHQVHAGVSALTII